MSLGDAPGSRLLSYRQLAAALSLGFLLRLFFIFHFRFGAGDSRFYEELARNWLSRGVYGIFLRGQLTPVDMRVPGYPAFLAGVYATLGQSRRAVLIVQALVDLATCVLTARIAARLAPAENRRWIATAALWLAALCPFTAAYSAVLLTETLATFLTSLAILLLLHLFEEKMMSGARASLNRQDIFVVAGRCLICGLVIGLGTLVRPEAPLLLGAAAIALCVRWWRPENWPKLALAGLWLTAGLAIALAPWAVRNVLSLGRAQFLAPDFAQTDGDFVPHGYYRWIRTWMVRPRDAYLTTWKLGVETIDIDDLPASAFDSPTEYARVKELLAGYNHHLQMTPPLDGEFATLAQQRIARHPARTFVALPIARAGMLWLTPHIELLPIRSDLWPVPSSWHRNHMDFSVTLGLSLLGAVCVGFAAIGAWQCRRNPGLVMIIAYLGLRTALMTQRPTVEPRYMILCVPAMLALDAIACGRLFRPSPRPLVTHMENRPLVQV